MTCTESKPSSACCGTETAAEQTKAPARSKFTPCADIVETKDSIIIRADMPGVNEKLVDITLEKNVLTIKGSVENSAPQGYSPAYAEYHDGNYERSFALGDVVSRENIQASMKNGVLKITLAKTGPTQARKIEVK